MKFLRRDSHKYSKLGKGRKNKQKWKKPTGRDNKMREKRKGRPAVVSVGYRTNKISRDTVDKKVPVYVKNVKEVKALRENEIPILGNIGMKNKIEVAKEAKKLDIKISNLNVRKFLKEIEFKNKKSVKKTEDNKSGPVSKTKSEDTPPKGNSTEEKIKEDKK